MRLFKKRTIAEARNNLMLLIISLICAIAGWFIIAMKIYPSATKEVYSIPIEFRLAGTTAASNGFQMYEPNVEKVNIKFDCSRTDYNQLNAESIKAYVDFDNIVTAGTKSLPIKVENSFGATMSNVIVTPSTVKLSLDKSETKTFALKSKTPNIKAADGKLIYEEGLYYEPTEIKLTGPSAKLARIAECYAVSNKADTLASDATLSTDEFQLYDAEGNEITDKKYITFDPAVVSINVPVLTQKTVKVDVLLVDAPSNFDRNCLKLNITPDTVTLAASSSETNIPDPLQIKLTLSTLDIGYSEDTDLEKMLALTNVKNISGTDRVNVTLDSEGLSSKELVLNDIHLTNVPKDNYDYTILTPQVKVKVVGPADIIDNITPNDLLAEVNMLGADTSKDQFSYNVTVSCKTHNNVWAVGGDLKETILKTPKEGVTTQASSPSSTTTTTY